MSDSTERTDNDLTERPWVMGTMIGVLALLGVAFWWLTTNHDQVEAWVAASPF